MRTVTATRRPAAPAKPGTYTCTRCGITRETARSRATTRCRDCIDVERTAA